MNITLGLYLISVAMNLKPMLGIACFIALIAAYGLISARWVFSDVRYMRPGVVALVIGVVAGALTAFIPDKEQIAYIVAGSYVANSEEMKQIPEEAAKTLNELMRAGQKKLKEETKE